MSRNIQDIVLAVLSIMFVVAVCWPLRGYYTVEMHEYDDVTGKLKAKHGPAVADARRFGGTSNGVFAAYGDAKAFAAYRNHLAQYGREYRYHIKRISKKEALRVG